jgi:predicted acylesterase/phospholipase RssA
MAVYDLVFEGGGAKGSGFAGALEALGEAGHTHRRLVGTSAGAITATFLAAHYSPQEMLAAVNERLPDGKPRFSSFMDPPPHHDFTDEEKAKSVTLEIFSKLDIPLVPEFLEKGLDIKLLNGLLALPHYRQLFSFVECGGLFAGGKFLEWVREKLAVKGIAADATLKTFHEQTGSDLSLVVSDTTDVEMMVLNHRTAPDCPVAWAVRMSMSIPFVWREVVWQESWGTYLGRSKTGNILVDGGVLSNFPIRLIDAEPAGNSFVHDVMGDTVAADAGTLGLLIDEKLTVEGADDTVKPPKLVGHLRTVQRVGRLVDTMTGAQDNTEIRRHEADICRLPAKGYGTTEFDMAPERLEALINGGRNAMRAHLAKN